jgi:hypothetical protein
VAGRGGEGRGRACLRAPSPKRARTRVLCALPLQERDASVLRVLLVDVLKLLALDGTYGERVRGLLDQSGKSSAREPRPLRAHYCVRIFPGCRAFSGASLG